jgi:hypothetical protein
MTFWSVPREWPGETAFIIAGGPSVLGQDLELLRDRRVIAINSSVYKVPWADILYFGDWRWWHEPENAAAVENFRGRAVTVSRLCSESKALLCRTAKPPGLALAHDSLMQKSTSLTADQSRRASGRARRHHRLARCRWSTRRRWSPASLRQAAPLAVSARLL